MAVYISWHRSPGHSMSSESNSAYLHAYEANIPPLYTILASLTWVLLDYFYTLEDEVRLVWPQRWNRGKIMFLWMRYYTIFLVAANALQIHLFTIPGITSNTVCLAVDPMLRIAGAISLWSVEIIIQLRIYALYGCSRKIAIFNAALFFCAILAFVGILTDLAIGRQKAIKSAIRLTLIGCPVVNTPIEWSEWIPATIYEVILFGFALYKYVEVLDLSRLPAAKKVMILTRVLVNDNILYFFGVTIVLLLNNLEVSGKTKIPWFGYGPFYASLGIMTTRMLLHLLESTLKYDEVNIVAADLDWTIDQNHDRLRFGSVSLFSTV
ncbi:hypothetical protein F5887DRAFT_1097461 [Amanita rubescens]|nr:hypothetical protein F5887DRAFT_1097461 [Amanita rubescens]